MMTKETRSDELWEMELYALKNNYSDNEIKLIEIEEDEFEKIKDDAVKINNKFKGYFDDSMNDFSVSLDKEEY